MLYYPARRKYFDRINCCNTFYVLMRVDDKYCDVVGVLQHFSTTYTL